MREVNRRDVVKGLGTVAATALIASRPADAAIPDGILKGAEKEGGVLWYDSYAREDGDTMLREFQKLYPFVKNATYIELPSAQKQARVIQECLAGGPTTDIYLNGPAQLQQLANRGFLHEVEWKELGVQDVVMATKHIITTANPISCLVVNTQKVNEADSPKTWDDLLDPKWKGRVGMWQRAAAIMVLMPEYGDDRTREYCRKFAANDPRLFSNSFQVAQAVGAGEIDVGIGFYDTVQRVVMKGAPVKMLFPEPVPVGNLCSSVCKFGKNPNAGKLLATWLQSKEGALVFENATQRGLVAVPETRSAQLVKGKKQAAWTSMYEIENSDHLDAFEIELNRILQKRA